MKAYISLEGDVTGEDSFYLKELANLIEEKCDLSVEIEKTGPQLGVKDSGFVIGLNIASLAFTAMQTFFSTLQFWESRQQNGVKYSVYVVVYSRTFQEKLLLKNLSAEKVIELKDLIHQHQLQSSPEDEYIEVKILKQK